MTVKETIQVPGLGEVIAAMLSGDRATFNKALRRDESSELHLTPDQVKSLDAGPK